MTMTYPLVLGLYQKPFVTKQEIKAIVSQTGIQLI